MPLIIPSNSISDGGYVVANSVRLNPPSNDYFNRTPSSASNRRTFTLSFWIKRWEISSSDWIIRATNGSGNATGLYFVGTQDKINIYSEDSGSAVMDLKTYRVFRDVSAWYHIVIAFDTTQSTDTNRVKLYVNGVQDANFQNTTYPSQNRDLHINTDIAHFIATDGAGSSNRLGCYFSEFCLIDGQQLDPTSFGEFDEDSGIWKPINVSGLTFGTNGFYLDFENSGSLGADVSGNGNNFTVNNLTSIDQTTDTPTNNFCTFNPIDIPINASGSTRTIHDLSDGNLTLTNTNSDYREARSTFYLTQGKWYFEAKSTREGGSQSQVGVVLNNYAAGSGHRRVYQHNQRKYDDGGSSVYGATWTTNDIIGVALNLDDGEITFYKNGSTQGVAFTDLLTDIDDTGWTPFFGSYNGDMSYNFGSPAFAISSGNADGNGYGNFEYAVPSGYLSLCTANLSEVLG